MTNADKIRAMTDEELAEVLRKAQRNQRLDMPWLSWLKQEADNG